jgi:inner membrane protein
VDPLTQAALGAAAAQAVFGRPLPRSAWLIGAVAGAAADLDVLIRPASDPLGGWSYHRGFTHSLVFIPVGGLIAALPFLFCKAFRQVRRQVLGAALVAYATHGLLDASTTFGTSLYWPFTERRVAWHLIGIVDPAFTLALLVGTGWAVRARRTGPARVGLALALCYLGLGLVQRERCLTTQRQLAESRGHTIERGIAMPTIGNLILWRSVYLAEDRFYTDAVRVSPTGGVTVRSGGSADRVTLESLETQQRLTPQWRNAFQKFVWFTDGFTARDALDASMIADVRYTTRPEVVSSLWGVYLPPPGQADEHAHLRPGPGRRDNPKWMWDALMGSDPRFVALSGIRP